MSWRTTSILIVCLTAVGLYTWNERSQDATDTSTGGAVGNPSAPEGYKPLLTFDPESVNVIRLHKGPAILQVRRESTGWSGAAQPQLIGDFVKNLRGLSELMILEAKPADLKDFGLDPAVGSIELLRTDGGITELIIGEHNPAGTGTYVRVGKDGPVALTGAVASWEFDKALRAVMGFNAAPTP